MNEMNCIIRRGEEEVFASNRRGIAPLISLIESGQDVKGCTAYDKIVGKAAALLYCLMGISEVHAGVLSVKAADVFREYRIAFSWQTLSESIVNRTGDGVCPMERTVENIGDPQEAFLALKAKLKELQSRSFPDKTAEGKNDFMPATRA